MFEPILVIMAAGMGSRYGGLKQIDPVGPCGEIILDYSLYDAYRAGFRRAVIVIKEENEADFRKLLACKADRFMHIDLCFQRQTDLPDGFSVPEGRIKPWGTGHAVLSAAKITDAPFCVINADDYYGCEAFRLCYEHLKNISDDSDYCMVGYRLKNTLSKMGSVARGVCVTDRSGCLCELTERTHIIDSVDGPLMTEDGEHYTRLDPDTVVSMNMWGFPRVMMDRLAEGFPYFLRENVPQNPMKAEYFLPTQVNVHMADGRCAVKVYTTPDRWYGVTYREDLEAVTASMRDMAQSGLYPMPLWAEEQA